MMPSMLLKPRLVNLPRGLLALEPLRTVLRSEEHVITLLRPPRRKTIPTALQVHDSSFSTFDTVDTLLHERVL